MNIWMEAYLIIGGCVGVLWGIQNKNKIVDEAEKVVEYSLIAKEHKSFVVWSSTIFGVIFEGVIWPASIWFILGGLIPKKKKKGKVDPK